MFIANCPITIAQFAIDAAINTSGLVLPKPFLSC